jgi:hypothetical protein
MYTDEKRMGEKLPRRRAKSAHYLVNEGFAVGAAFIRVSSVSIRG